MMRLLLNSTYSHQQQLFKQIALSFLKLIVTINNISLSPNPAKGYILTELMTSYIEQAQTDFRSFCMQTNIYSLPSEFMSIIKSSKVQL